jgi:hypothetical protein
MPTDMLPQAKAGSSAPAVWARLFLLLYLLLLGLATWKHTLWRDECQAWTIVRASHSLHQVLHNTRYEGHPPLWFFVIYPLTWVTANPGWIKLPNLLCAVVSALLIFRSRQLPWWVRFGSIFSYYLFFEYALIARNYMLGIMLLLAAVAMMRASTRHRNIHRNRHVWVFPLLGLAALSSLPALIVSFCLALYCIGSWLTAKQPSAGADTYRLPLALGIAGFAVCCVVSAAIIRPPADSVNLPEKPFYRLAIADNIKLVDRVVVSAYLPNPPWRHAFWNLTAIDALPARLLAATACLLIVSLVLVLSKTPSRVFFLGASMLLVLQMLLSQRTYLRHVGWLFIVFMLALLLDRMETGAGASPPALKLFSWRGILLGAVLLSQVTAGLFAVAVSLRYPFSTAPQVVAYMRQHGLENATIVPWPLFAATSPMAYLGRPTVYNFGTREDVPFVVWNKRNLSGVFVPSVLPPPGDDGQPPLIITPFPIYPAFLRFSKVRLLASFTDGICRDEQFYLYQSTVDQVPQTTAPDERAGGLTFSHSADSRDKVSLK